MRILSIDPGSKHLGYAIFDDGKLTSYGLVQANKIRDKHARSYTIVSEVSQLLTNAKPDEVVVEEYYSFSRRVGSDVVPNIRGAIFYLLTKAGIKIAEVNPRRVKKCVTGNGNAPKPIVKNSVITREHVPDKMKPDVYDAIAIGITYMNRSGMKVA